MFPGWFRKKKSQLSGVPAVRRLKTYSAESGYVYQYYFEGKRESAAFVFSVSADRRNWREITVVLTDSPPTVRERVLTSTDLYAVAKIALFASFDRCVSPSELQDLIHVRECELQEVADRLGW
jgi:hypothetical protein